ncbi:MAG: FAD-dependent oxidoreductase [Magnetospirillum sp.]|nr:FAD-dependent oxidoreductase [Magnetospirillum sp.]
MTEDRFDAIVVGAGPSGNAAAYTMAKSGLKVLQLERGEYPGSKNVQGAILYADAVEKVIPDFREDAPLERHVIEQRLWMMNEASHTGIHYRSDDFNEERPNRYTIIRAQFDKWFSRKVREAGAVVLCETTVTELVRGGRGEVIGVRTDRDGGCVLADVVVLADGVNGLVGQRAGLRTELEPDTVALAVKEMHFLPREVIDARFNLKGDEGAVIEAMGTVTDGMVGTAFLYTNRESISVGIGCLVSDFAQSQTTPYQLLERFKRHPSIGPLLAGSEVKEYAAHLIPEGGYKAVPEICGDGWVVVGDSGHFVNAIHREGSNLAMTTGRIAGETVARLKRSGAACTRANLAEYRASLDASFVMKDLRKYKDVPRFLDRTRQVFGLYPHLINQASQTWFRVDGVDKRTKEREILASFRKSRSLGGLIGDAIKLARAWR